jgi:hypothetical protein
MENVSDRNQIWNKKMKRDPKDQLYYYILPASNGIGAVTILLGVPPAEYE